MKVIWKSKTKNSFNKAKRNSIFLFFSKVFVKLNKIIIILPIILLVFITSLFYIIKYMSSPRFEVQSINFYGSELSRKEDLDAIRSLFVGKNIFLLRTPEIEKITKEKGTYVDEVYAEKLLPSTIEIHLIEKKPSMIYINFPNAYLVDENLEVLDTLSNQVEIRLSKAELEIIRGYGNPNSKDIIDRILADTDGLTEENKEDIISKITDDQKKQTLNKIREEINTKIEDSYKIHSENAAKSRFWHFPKVYIYEDTVYEPKQRLNKDKIKSFLAINDFFKDRQDFQVARFQWESDFKLAVRLTSGKVFYFSSKRDIKVQTSDLIDVLNQLKLEGKPYSLIDVGSDKIVVER